MIICRVVYCFACLEWQESKQMWCCVCCPNNDVLCRWKSISVCDVSFRVGIGHLMIICDFDSHDKCTLSSPRWRHGRERQRTGTSFGWCWRRWRLCHFMQDLIINRQVLLLDHIRRCRDRYTPSGCVQRLVHARQRVRQDMQHTRTVLDGEVIIEYDIKPLLQCMCQSLRGTDVRERHVIGDDDQLLMSPDVRMELTYTIHDGV